MAKKTTNYNLHKIDLTDAPPDITVLNDNFDIIDNELNRLAEEGGAPPYTYGTEDLEAGVSPLETGKLHFVYE